MNEVLKVAGVTFPNDDGESRQEILKSLGFGWKLAELKQTTYDGERAVTVWVDGKQIGWVAKDQLGSPLSYEKYLNAQILYFEQKDLIFAELSKPLSAPQSQPVTQPEPMA